MAPHPPPSYVDFDTYVDMMPAVSHGYLPHSHYTQQHNANRLDSYAYAPTSSHHHPHAHQPMHHYPIHYAGHHPQFHPTAAPYSTPASTYGQPHRLHHQQQHQYTAVDHQPNAALPTFDASSVDSIAQHAHHMSAHDTSDSAGSPQLTNMNKSQKSLVHHPHQQRQHIDHHLLAHSQPYGQELSSKYDSTDMATADSTVFREQLQHHTHRQHEQPPMGYGGGMVVHMFAAASTSSPPMSPVVIGGDLQYRDLDQSMTKKEVCQIRSGVGGKCTNDNYTCVSINKKFRFYWKFKTIFYY